MAGQSSAGFRMRLVLALSFLAASALGAHAAEDRYGPPRVRSSAAAGPQMTPTGALPASAAPYGGALLSWGGKAPGQEPAPTAVAGAPALPQPIAPWAGQATGPQRPAPYPSIVAPVMTPTPAAYAPPPAQPVAPPPVAATQPLPTSLYDRPAAIPAPQPTAPVQRAALPPAPTTQPAQPYQPPRSPTASLPPAPSQPARIAGPEEARPRAYSVIREFGGTPDPINIPPPTSYWATRPETAPPADEADTSEFATAGGVGASEVAAAEGQGAEDAAAARRAREEKAARAAAAARDSGK